MLCKKTLTRWSWPVQTCCWRDYWTPVRLGEISLARLLQRRRRPLRADWVRYDIPYYCCLFSLYLIYSWQLFFIVKERVRSEVFPNNIMFLVGMFVFVVCLSVCRILPIGLRGHSYSNRLLLWDWCHDMLDLQIMNWNLVIRGLTSCVWHCVHMWNSVFIHCPNLVVLVDFWGQSMSYSTYGSRFLPDF